MTERHLFVVNPVAGRKDRSAAIKTAVENLLLTDPFDVYVTKSPGDATVAVERYIREHHGDYIRVYACGGDGTLCETANGVYNSGSGNCALGVVPIGSGNDFAKNFDITADRFRNLRALTVGAPVPIDLLSVEDPDGVRRISLNIVSAGFDAAVCKGQEKYKRLPLVSGSTAYNMSVVKCVFTETKHRFRLYADGEQVNSGRGPYLFALGANGSYYGGGYKAAPYAELSDGLLDMITIDTVSKLKFAALVGKFRAGRHIEEMKDIVFYTRCKSMRIESDAPIDVNIDGEIVPMRDPTITILPAALNIILPPENDAI